MKISTVARFKFAGRPQNFNQLISVNESYLLDVCVAWKKERRHVPQHEIERDLLDFKTRSKVVIFHSIFFLLVNLYIYIFILFILFHFFFFFNLLFYFVIRIFPSAMRSHPVRVLQIPCQTSCPLFANFAEPEHNDNNIKVLFKKFISNSITYGFKYSHLNSIFKQGVEY